MKQIVRYGIHTGMGDVWILREVVGGIEQTAFPKEICLFCTIGKSKRSV
jgi:hypothetical protein